MTPQGHGEHRTGQREKLDYATRTSRTKMALTFFPPVEMGVSRPLYSHLDLSRDRRCPCTGAVTLGGAGILS